MSTADRPFIGEPGKWCAWAPDAPEPDPLLTRAELLGVLAAYGVEPRVTETDLRYWEYQGVTPAPVRRKHRGATRAVYPHWVALMVADLRFLQRSGYSLADIAPVLRASAPDYARVSGDPGSLAEHMRPLFVRVNPRAWLPPSPLLTRFPFLAFPLPPFTRYALAMQLGTLAKPHREAGVRLTHATILLRGPGGRPIVYETELPEPAAVEAATSESAPAPPNSQTPSN